MSFAQDGGYRHGPGVPLALGREFKERVFQLSFGSVGPALRRAAGCGLHYLLPMSKRVYIETYGCQMNVADSELMFGLLGRDGYVRAEDPGEADVMLVNTCAVRDNAEQRVIGRMGELSGTSVPATSSVSWVHGPAPGPGCSSRCPGWIWWSDPMPTGTSRTHRPGRSGTAAQRRRVPEWEHYEDVPPVREKGPTAFVTVQRGCDYRCTFCIVRRPAARSGAASRRRARGRELAAAGTTEVTLLGQTVNSYSRRPARLRRPAAGRRSVEGCGGCDSPALSDRLLGRV
jgi:tRNA A37 methylthiotransferase MiaB